MKFLHSELQFPQEQEGRRTQTDRSFLVSQFTEPVYFFKQIQQ